MTSSFDDRWRPTPALVRAVALVVLTVPVALLWRRPDLLVLAAPCAVVLAWSVVTRPRAVPQRRFALSHGQVREGEQVLALVDVEPVEGTDLVATALSPAPFVEGVAAERHARVEDADGLPVLHASAVADADGPLVGGLRRLLVGLRVTRWGVRRIGPAQVAAVSSWGSYRWGPVRQEPLGLRVLPEPTVFDSDAPAPRPRPAPRRTARGRSRRPAAPRIRCRRGSTRRAARGSSRPATPPRRCPRA